MVTRGEKQKREKEVEVEVSPQGLLRACGVGEEEKPRATPRTLS